MLKRSLILPPHVRTATGTEGWVAAGFTSAAMPAIVTSPIVGPTTPAAATGVDCSNRRTCGQITSCEEAQAFLASCSWGYRLDADHDGTACDRQCQ